MNGASRWTTVTSTTAATSRSWSAGLEGEGFTIHALRHTFATALFTRGEHPKVVQSLIGHSSIT